MSDNLKETLSAFIDGEATEIEVHRLLRASEDGSRSWVHYQQIRAVARGERALSAEHHEMLRDRIRSFIDDEEGFDEAPALPRRSGAASYARPVAAFSVAASLLVAVFVGYNLNQGIDGTPGATAPTVAETQRSAPIEVQTVANAAPVPAGELELRELDEETLRAVREYLNQHDRTVRMQPVLYIDNDGTK